MALIESIEYSEIFSSYSKQPCMCFSPTMVYYCRGEMETDISEYVTHFMYINVITHRSVLKGQVYSERVMYVNRAQFTY